MSVSNIKSVDFHEAGHVLIALLMGYRESIRHVSMRSDSRSGAQAHVYTVPRIDEVGPPSALSDFRKVARNMGGIAAELVTGNETRDMLRRINSSDNMSAKHNALLMCLRGFEANEKERFFEGLIEYTQKYSPKDWHQFIAFVTEISGRVIKNSKFKRVDNSGLYSYRAENIVNSAIDFDIELIKRHKDDLNAIAELLSKNGLVYYPQIEEVVPHLCDVGLDR